MVSKWQRWEDSNPGLLNSEACSLTLRKLPPMTVSRLLTMSGTGRPEQKAGAECNSTWLSQERPEKGELSLGRWVSWLFTRKTRRKGHSGKRTWQKQRHGSVLAHLRNCKEFGCGDLKEEAEKRGLGGHIMEWGTSLGAMGTVQGSEQRWGTQHGMMTRMLWLLREEWTWGG